MGERDASAGANTNQGWANDGDGRHGASVLCVDPDEGAVEHVRRILDGLPVRLRAVATPAEARRALDDGAYDVVLLDVRARDGSGFAFAREIAERGGATRTIAVCTRPTVALSVEAMRSGAVDLLRKPLDPDELLERLDTAIEQADDLRRRERRVERLRRACRRLTDAKAERDADGSGVVTGSGASGYAGARGPAAVGAEFEAMIRQELDVEALLRRTLEYLLTKTGPTNAAVFLPTGHEDYSLGAYVNYDVDKGAADVLLDQLADTLAPRFDDQTDLLLIPSGAELEAALDDAAPWMGDSDLLVFACHHEGECLAVVALFRSPRSPFGEALMPTLRTIRDLFAAQLARVIRVHNRHKGEDAWLGFDVDEGGEDAPDDFPGGYGDIAA